MKFISFAELEPGRNFPKMTDSMESGPYSHKEEIIQYLLNGNVEFVRVSRAKDVFTGEYIPREVRVMRDGDYCWPNLLAWYVDKYNVRLPREFEEHILSKK